MQSITVTQVAAGSSAVEAVSYFTNPFNIGLGAVLTGTATFTVEYSMQDPMDAGYVAASATWFPVTGLSAVSATTGAALTIPCRAIRLTLAGGSTGSVTLYIQQAGTR
jgi:hypothetical protein